MKDAIKLKLNSTDSDMIEFITETPSGRRTMWGAAHIDFLWQREPEDRHLFDTLKKQGEIKVLLVEE